MSAARALGVAALLAGSLWPAAGAFALLDDRLELSIAETLNHDDNVFRLSSGRDPNTALGSPAKADAFHTTTFGLKLDVPVSRQRFQGELAVSDTRYDRYSILNLTGHNARALWLWQLGNQLSGEAGYSDAKTLASLANVQSGLQSSTPNFVTTSRLHASAVYSLGASWRLRGELARLEQSNAAPERRVNDIAIDSLDTSLSYVSRAQNQIGLGLRFERAHLPQQQPVAGTLVDNDYRQHGVALLGEWTISAHSRLSGRGGWVRRSYEQLPQRDFDDATYRFAYDWQPTAKLAFNATLYREISTLEEINVGFVRAKGYALRPTYRMTEKIEFSGLLDYSIRDYRGEAERALGTLPARTDRLRLAVLSASYRPTPKVLLGLAWRRETRRSSAEFGDYASTALSVSARIAF